MAVKLTRARACEEKSTMLLAFKEEKLQNQWQYLRVDPRATRGRHPVCATFTSNTRHEQNDVTDGGVVTELRKHQITPVGRRQLCHSSPSAVSVFAAAAWPRRVPLTSSWPGSQSATSFRSIGPPTGCVALSQSARLPELLATNWETQMGWKDKGREVKEWRLAKTE
jgi:hypothetical protein